jgi:branched-chain amino acid transport system ATP-binding protein
MPEPLLAVEDLNAWYGSAHIVQGASFVVADEPVAVIGRNGMGKSTLCHAILGLVDAEPGGRVSGSVRLAGDELVGRSVHKIAAAGIGYVPQGRRIFPSLNVHEHLRMVSRRGSSWTPDRVYELWPRLAERRKVGAGSLSGGEQQMLAIGRALLTEPRLVIMDEPSEGLAPTVVAELTHTLARLVAEGLRMLVVEQNLSVATSVSRRLLVMLNGRVVDETTPAALESDPGAKQRYLGVTPRAGERSVHSGTAAPAASDLPGSGTAAAAASDPPEGAT